jgi:hypothetical protein
MICLVHVKLCTNVRVYFIERFITKKNVNGYIENDQKMIYQSHTEDCCFSVIIIEHICLPSQLWKLSEIDRYIPRQFESFRSRIVHRTGLKPIAPNWSAGVIYSRLFKYILQHWVFYREQLGPNLLRSVLSVRVVITHILI